MERMVTHQRQRQIQKKKKEQLSLFPKRTGGALGFLPTGCLARFRRRSIRLPT